MILHVTKAKYLKGYEIEVWFNDGNHGVVDLSAEEFFQGPMFETLRDVTKFSKFSVDPELSTIVWENGADLAPEYLEEKLKPSKRL